MATCAISGTLKDLSETAISGATVRANIISSIFSGTTQLVPKEITTTTASDGTWTLNLSQSVSAQVTIEYPPNSTDSAKPIKYSITVPATTTANFSTLATEL
jgi:hypothetical protein